MDKKNYDKLDEGLSLLDIIKILKINKKLILMFMLIGFIFSSFYLFLEKPVYRSWCTYFISSSSSLESPSLYSSFIGRGNNNLDEKILSIIKSQELAKLVAKDVIHKYPDFNKKFHKNPEISSNDLKATKGILKLGKGLNLEQDASSLIKISYFFSDPTIAIDVVTFSIKNTQKLYKKLELGSHKQIIKILDPPQSSGIPITKNPIIVILLGIIIGFTIASTLCVFKFTFLEE